jgi:hypothetical protein
LTVWSGWGSRHIFPAHDTMPTISQATAEDRVWAARLMAASEPWMRLRHGYEQCLAVVQPQPDYREAASQQTKLESARRSS